MIIAVDRLLMIIHHEMRPSSVLKVRFLLAAATLFLYICIFSLFSTHRALTIQTNVSGQESIMVVMILSVILLF